MPAEIALLLGAGVVAGFIDAVAGGAALITIPVLAIVLRPGVQAIGTSKVIGLASALVALLVYLSRGRMLWSRALSFGLWVGLGSAAGSAVAQTVPVSWFKWLLVAVCPALLFLVLRRDRWTAAAAATTPGSRPRRGPAWLDSRTLGAGLCCGFYDGFFGPAGGTFMLLALVLLVRLPLLEAVTISKFVNAVADAASLTTYAHGGVVHWGPGAAMALAVAVGAFSGARRASRCDVRVIQGALVAVVVLLVVYLIAGPGG